MRGSCLAMISRPIDASIPSTTEEGKIALKRGQNGREPDPTDPSQYCPYDTHSVDLSLGEEIVIPESATYSFDLSQPEPLGPFRFFRFAPSALSGARKWVNAFDHLSISI
jgi:hypothetical protein